MDGKELVTVAAIPVPDLSSPMAMRSWPEWLTTKKNALATNFQKEGGGFQKVWTLPPDMILTEAQQAALGDYIRSLSSWRNQTGVRAPKWLARTMTAVSGMLMVLGGHKATTESVEVKAFAYEAALADVPCWAVECAAGRWYRGECGRDVRGQPFDYRFMPDPATLRSIALKEVAKLDVEISEMHRILDARPLLDNEAELRRGKQAMAGFWKTWASGSEALAALTFEQAVELGSVEPGRAAE